jgi:hypothetical protein
MAFTRRKPAADKADRPPISFAVAAETGREDTQKITRIQARHLQLRFGLTAPTACAVASLAFAEVRR